VNLHPPSIHRIAREFTNRRASRPSNAQAGNYDIRSRDGARINCAFISIVDIVYLDSKVRKDRGVREGVGNSEWLVFFSRG